MTPNVNDRVTLAVELARNPKDNFGEFHRRRVKDKWNRTISKEKRDFSLRRPTRRGSDGKEEVGLLRSK